MGHLNGYIALRKNESIFEYMSYDDISSYINVHGGFTFFTDKEDDGIWYQYDKDGKEIFWIGFDCGHGFDFSPYVQSIGGTYKDINYVKEEIKSVINQLEKMKDKEVKRESKCD